MTTMMWLDWYGGADVLLQNIKGETSIFIVVMMSEVHVP